MTFTARGRYVWKPDDSFIKWAQARRAVEDRSRGHNADLFDGAHRWVGLLAELGLSEMLTERELEHEWHNRAHDAGIADFDIAGESVGVKCGATTTTIQPDYHAIVPAQHRGRADTELFFAHVDRLASTPRVVLLGGMRADDYFAQATRLSRGERIRGGYVANECYALALCEVPPVIGWLARLFVSASA